MSKPIEPIHVGDGLYFLDEGYCVNIAVNHHLNTVAVLDINNIDTAIEYLQKVKERLKQSNGIVK